MNTNEVKDVSPLTTYLKDKNELSKFENDFKSVIAQRWFSVPYEVSKVCSPEACILYGHLIGFTSSLYRGTNTALASSMNCSTRTISRLMNELQQKGCIRVVILSRSTRLIYPVYTLPFIYDIESSKKKNSNNETNELNDNSDNGGFRKL